MSVPVAPSPQPTLLPSSDQLNYVAPTPDLSGASKPQPTPIGETPPPLPALTDGGTAMIAPPLEKDSPEMKEKAQSLTNDRSEKKSVNDSDLVFLPENHIEEPGQPKNFGQQGNPNATPQNK